MFLLNFDETQRPNTNNGEASFIINKLVWNKQLATVINKIAFIAGISALSRRSLPEQEVF